MSESPIPTIAGGIERIEDGSPVFSLDRDPFVDSGQPDPKSSPAGNSCDY